MLIGMLNKIDREQIINYNYIVIESDSNYLNYLLIMIASIDAMSTCFFIILSML